MKEAQMADQRPTMHWTAVSDGQGGSFLHAVWSLPGDAHAGSHAA